MDLLNAAIGVNIHAQVERQPPHSIRHGVDAAAWIPDAAGQLDVCNYAEHGGGLVGRSAGVRGVATEQLAQVARVDVALDQVAERAGEVNAQQVARVNLGEGAQAGRLAVDKDRPGNAVDARGVGQKAQVALNVALVDLLDLAQHVGEIARGVKRCAVSPAVARQRLDGQQVDVIGQFAPGFGKELLEDVAHRDDRGAGVPVEAVGGILVHLAADNGILLVDADLAAARREPNRRAQAADARADDGDLGWGHGGVGLVCWLADVWSWCVVRGT